jgi:hypothetical protein
MVSENKEIKEIISKYDYLFAKNIEKKLDDINDKCDKIISFLMEED